MIRYFFRIKEVLKKSYYRKNMNIFFIHKGNPFYLKYTLAQAVKTQPNSRIVLLGDEYNRELNICEWYPLKDYNQSGLRFSTQYVHLSPNDYDFELFCIQRWLYLSEYVRKNSVSGPIVYIDSDVLLYYPLIKRFEEQQFDLGITKEIGPAVTLFRNSAVLFRFENFICNAYKEKSTLDILKNIFYNGISPFWMKNKYVSDMQLLGLFALTVDSKIDLSIPWNGWVYDYAFGLDEGYRYNPYKRIKWLGKDSKGFFGKKGSVKYYFAALHFQVGAKIFIPQYYTGNIKFNDYYIYQYIKWRGRITTVIKFILHNLKLHKFY